MSGDRRLTRGGKAVVAIAAVGLVMGWGFGGRSLNAVVVPAAALVAVAWLGVARAQAPEVERSAPHHGFVDETATVELSVDADRGVSVTVEEDVPEALGDALTFETIADGRAETYDLTLAKRGVYDVGPASVTVTDVFGLWEVEFSDDETDEVVVFPRILPLYESTGIISGYVGLTEEREQFDSLREYQQGDALRDVNWKASAKRGGDLVVTEYAGEGAESSVMIGVGTGSEIDVDPAAEAAASLAAHMLDAGLAVGMVTPWSRLGPGSGTDHRHELLTLLARYDGTGHAIDTDEVDVAVIPTGSGARIETGGRTQPFEEIIQPTRRRASA